MFFEISFYVRIYIKKKEKKQEIRAKEKFGFSNSSVVTVFLEQFVKSQDRLAGDSYLTTRID